MSMFDDIALVRSEFDDSWLIESLEAVERLDALRQQYEALAPDWTQAPDWAEWYTIDADGDSWWRCDGKSKYDKLFNLPLGIDWRLCKWQRPEVTA